MAKESDCHQIADIHMAAFGTNAMLQAQFPTPLVREELKLCIAQKALDDIRDPKMAVLVVRDQEGEMISFAKWSLPIFESETYIESPWRWPEGTDFMCLDVWTEKVEAAKQKVLGDKPCCRKSFRAQWILYSVITWAFESTKEQIVAEEVLLPSRPKPTLGQASCARHIFLVQKAYLTSGLSFLGTHPLHERRGAASLLIKWGVDRCIEDHVPALLESTVDAGPLYRRHGFRAAEDISMELGQTAGGMPVVYEETSFLYTHQDV